MYESNTVHSLLLRSLAAYNGHLMTQILLAVLYVLESAWVSFEGSGWTDVGIVGAKK